MKIAVIGDSMTDIDTFVEPVKVAAEAPIVVFKVLSKTSRPGGSGNVANMCQALGAEVLHLYANDRIPTVKNRIISVIGGIETIVCRYDEEVTTPLQDCDTDRICEAVSFFNPSKIIVCDHGKGTVTLRLLEYLKNSTKLHDKIFIDPINQTPNCAGLMATWIGNSFEIPSIHCGPIRIIKKGSKGIEFIRKEELTQYDFSKVSYCDKPLDTLGAGDQFISSLVVARCLGLGWEPACEKASKDAGEQCLRRGCVPVTREESDVFK